MGRVRRKIVWTEPARFDLRRLKVWTERNSLPEKAKNEGQRLKQAIETLQYNPRLGTRQPMPDTGNEELRELVVKPYIIRYVLEDERIVLIRMWHSREHLRQS